MTFTTPNYLYPCYPNSWLISFSFFLFIPTLRELDLVEFCEYFRMSLSRCRLQRLIMLQYILFDDYLYFSMIVSIFSLLSAHLFLYSRKHVYLPESRKGILHMFNEYNHRICSLCKGFLSNFNNQKRRLGRYFCYFWLVFKF